MKTVDALYRQYGKKFPPLMDVARDFLGLNDEADISKRALKNDLGGIRAFRMGSRKSPWLCDIEQIAQVLDEKMKG